MSKKVQRAKSRVAELTAALARRQEALRMAEERKREAAAIEMTRRNEAESLQRQSSALARRANAQIVVKASEHQKQQSKIRRRASKTARLSATCKYPTRSSSAAYKLGCRCRKCWTAHSDYMRRYMRARRERVQATARARQADVERTQAWRRANPDKYKTLNKQTGARRRARIHATQTADQTLLEAIVRACLPGMEVDHIVPLAHGGAHVPTNLQYLQARHNKAQGARRGYQPPSEAVCRWQDVPLLIAAHLANTTESRLAQRAASNRQSSIA
jgi:5-methylcytosine-specific restriction endonuclease McrA